MKERANVQTLDALKEAKAALARFAEDAGAILATVDSDIARMGQWLTHDRPSHWKREVRKREEAVQAARQEISRKQLVQAPEPASTVLERKELARCQRRVEEARKRQEATRRWSVVWEKESMMARGAIMSLAEFVRTDIPRAMSRIDRMLEQLEEYLSIAAPPTDLPAGVGAASGSEGGEGESMARPIAPTAPDESTRYAALRLLVEEARSRVQKTREPLAWEAWPLDPLDHRVGEQLSRLAAAGDAVATGQTITIAAKALERPLVWLARVSPLDAQDSGWYLAPLDNPEVNGACWRVPLSDLLASRGDLKPILELGKGVLVVLGPTGPLTILDGENRNVWLADG